VDGNYRRTNFVMKKLLWVAVAVGALATGPAMSADLEPSVFQHPAPPPLLVPAYTWTGCYLGGNGGFGSSSWKYSNPSDNPTVPGERGTIVANDVVLGGQVGCDYQAGGLVLGVQGSLDWTQMKGRFFDAIELFFNEDAQVRWFATATGRVGITVTPQALVHAKDGAAWVNNHYDDLLTQGPGTNTIDGSAGGTRLG
jgi:outer membrane immunogenic protein